MHMYALFVAYVKRRGISTFKIYLIAARVWRRYNFGRMNAECVIRN